MKTNKNKGLSLIISLGASMIVLGIAVSTMKSVTRSLEQSSDTERSTQLFFASESGIEAAFFHHDARGQGVHMTGNSNDLKLSLPGTNAEASWEIRGRSELEDDNSTPIFAGVLKEHQVISIPLFWDVSVTPVSPTAKQQGVDGFITGNNDDLQISFFNEPSDVGDNSVEDYLEELIGVGGNKPSDIDFGESVSGENEILIDWSFSRRDADYGIQTFTPVNNNDCTNNGMGAVSDRGFICENDIITGAPFSISTNEDIVGRVLPGNTENVKLSEFFACTDPARGATSNCSDYKISIKSLLKYEDSNNPNKKIVGIPFSIEEVNNGGVDLPMDKYVLNSRVTMGDFVRNIELSVSERTAIGAFDYVIFD